ncbi:MAG: hypothetical protein AAGC60_25335 [Acidobacteriota bacterium]
MTTHHPPRSLHPTLIVAVALAWSLAFAPSAFGAPADAITQDEAPTATEATPALQPMVEACTANAEAAGDELAVSVLALLGFETNASWGTCPQPLDCRYGGYCYFDCSRCEVNSDCPFNTCTPIRLC